MKIKQVITNFQPLIAPLKKATSVPISFNSLDKSELTLGKTLKLLSKPNLIVIYQTPRAQIKISLIKLIFFFIVRAKIVVIDHNFSWPERSFKNYIKLNIWRIIYSQIDLSMQHMHWNKNIEYLYRIPEKKFEYTPFKINSEATIREHAVKEHEYVVTGGYSSRDFDTFCKAMSTLPFKGRIITSKSRKHLESHRTPWDMKNIPSNVEVVEATGKDWWSQLAFAKIVVFTIPTKTVSGAGISAALTSLGLGKCVIMTQCPATKDVFEDKKHMALIPAENSDILAEKIKYYWESDSSRDQLKKSGKEYAWSCFTNDIYIKNMICTLDDKFQLGDA